MSTAGQPFEYIWVIDGWSTQIIDPISPKFVIEGLTFNMQACIPKHATQFFGVKVVLNDAPKSTKMFSFNVSLINWNEGKSVTKRMSKGYSKIGAYETFTFVSTKLLNENSGFLKNDCLKIMLRYEPPALRQKHARNQQVKSKQNEEKRIPLKSPSMEAIKSIVPIIQNQNGCKFSGLKNQGATCYLNSILQMLFHLPSFRRIVYAMPTTGIEDIKTSIPLNLQRLFCTMQFNKNKSCSTLDLTRSFGWNQRDTSMQQDIQEFENELIDNLERKLKNTELADNISMLFCGKQKDYIRGLNVDFHHETTQTYSSLSLTVKGYNNLYESLNYEIEPDELVGENQYKTDEFGVQDVLMGTEYLSFPPVLRIYLRRFERDYALNRNIKINSKFGYPETIDLTKYMSSDLERNKSNIYELHGVLVHSGTITSGHYYAFLRPSIEDKWYKFDDSNVSEVQKEEAIENNFGGIDPRTQKEKTYNAYMLVYVRKEDVPLIYEPISEENVPIHLREWILTSEEKSKDKILQSDYLDIKINTEKNIQKNSLKFTTGFINRESTFILRFSRDESLLSLYEKISNTQSKPISEIRLWKCGSYSIPNEIIPLNNDKVGSILTSSSSIFVQSKQSDEKLLINEDERVLYLKFFFPTKEPAFQFIGSIIVKRKDFVDSLFPYVNEIVHLPPLTPLLVFQETIQSTAQLITNPQTTEINSLGSLLIFQLSPGIEAPEPYYGSMKCIENDNDLSYSYFPNPLDLPVFSYYNLFPELRPTTVDQFINFKLRTLEVELFEYSEPTKQLAIIRFPSNLGWPALKRLISIATSKEYDPETDSMNLYKYDLQTNGPCKTVISLRFLHSLRNTITQVKNERAKLYFEIHKGIPESMISNMAYYNVQYSQDAFNITFSAKLLILKNSKVRQIGYELQNRGLLPQSDSIRVLSIKNNQILQIIDPEAVYTSYELPIRFEMIPQEQRGLTEEQILISVSRGYITSNNIMKTTLSPFLFHVKKNDKIKDITDPLLRWAEITDEDKPKVKIMKSIERNLDTIEPNETMEMIVKKGYKLFLSIPKLENLNQDTLKVTFVDHPPPKKLEAPLKIFN